MIEGGADFGSIEECIVDRSDLPQRRKHSQLHFRSVLHPGHVYRLVFNQIQHGKTYYRCSNCYQASGGVVRPSIAVREGRFVTDPDRPKAPHVCTLEPTERDEAVAQIKNQRQTEDKNISAITVSPDQKPVVKRKRPHKDRDMLEDGSDGNASISDFFGRREDMSFQPEYPMWQQDADVEQRRLHVLAQESRINDLRLQSAELDLQLKHMDLKIKQAELELAQEKLAKVRQEQVHPQEDGWGGPTH